MPSLKNPIAGWRQLSTDQRWAVLFGPILVAVVAGLLIPRLNDLLPGTGPAGDLQVIDSIVHNPDGDHLEAGRPNPKLEVKVHNTGTRRVVITHGQVEVRQLIVLPWCEAPGAALRETGRYDVALPASPGSNGVVEVPVNQQVGPDEADRFAFSFGVVRTEPPESVRYTVRVYQLDVALRHDGGGAPVKVGTFVLALPSVPGIHERAAIFPERGIFPRRCAKSNRASARRALQLDGRRSEAFATGLGAR